MKNQNCKIVQNTRNWQVDSDRKLYVQTCNLINLCRPKGLFVTEAKPNLGHRKSDIPSSLNSDVVIQVRSLAPTYNRKGGPFKLRNRSTLLLAGVSKNKKVRREKYAVNVHARRTFSELRPCMKAACRDSTPVIPASTMVIPASTLGLCPLFPIALFTLQMQIRAACRL